MESSTEADPDATAKSSAPAAGAQLADPSIYLSTHLEQMSINSTESRPATAPVSPIQARKPPIQRSNTQDNQARPLSRRTSANSAIHSSPTSPALRRKSSGASQASDQVIKPSPRRQSSQNLSRRSSMAPASSTSSIPEDDRPILTAASIAADHFRKELETHKNALHNAPKTMVVIHDSCYGHRFSRRKTTKANLSLIVERPERIKASVLGLSSAYVRLGERHASGQHEPHPHKSPSLQLPFLIHKSTRSTPITSTAVTNVHGTKWMHDLVGMCNSAQTKLAAGHKELSRPDSAGPSSKPKLHEGDLYLCQESLEAFQGALGGVIDAVDSIFGHDFSSTEPKTLYKRAFVCVRPPGHHCSADMPSGFCWLNNVHVGIEHAALSHGLTHAAIIDFDLHHGDGSQTIAWERNAKAARMPKNTPLSKKTSIGYFSLHDINSYPCEWGDQEKVQSASLCIENAHNQSIWNVHLQPWKTEAEFWELYQTRYVVLLDKARAFLQAQTQRIQASSSAVKPKAAIFISAGFDASEWEGEGMQRHKVNVPTEFYARFTADIVKLADELDTGVDGRVISVLEGGYSDRALMSGVMSHLSGLVGPNKSAVDGSHASGSNTFNKEWWSSSALTELEAALNLPAAIPASRKIRSSELSSFAIPTQSFTAKVVDPAKVYRSLSGLGSPPVERPRLPTPPPPEVDWATAACELSKLLIPGDRRVDSYKHDELAEPRVKKDRYSSIGMPLADQAPPPQHPLPQTRGRKAKTPAYPGGSPAAPVRTPVRRSSKGRRRTLSDLPSLPDESTSNVTNSLDQQLERPTTADSKAQSEGNVSSTSIIPNATRTIIEPDSSLGELRLGKTRRQSGILADIQHLNEHQYPPETSSEVVNQNSLANSIEGASQRISTTQPSSEFDTSRSEAKDMEALTTGVKKITLRMNSKEPQQNNVAAVKKPATKAPRKSTAPRAPKSTAAIAKTGAPRTTKGSKAVAATENGATEQALAPPSQEVLNTASASIGESVTEPNLSSQEPMSWDPSRKSTTSQPLMPEPFPIQPQQESNIIDSNSAYVEPTTVPSSNIPASNDIDVVAIEQSAEQNGTLTVSTQPTEFIPYHPPPQYASQGVKPDSITWLPPNTDTPVGTPMAKRGKENLPVFTSDGHIPFATPSRSELDGTTASPYKVTVLSQPQFSGPVSSNFLQGNAAPDLTKADTLKAEDQSIWDIPDSPVR